MTVLSAGEDVNPQECLHMAGRGETGTITWENVLVKLNIYIPSQVLNSRISRENLSGHNSGSFQ